MTQYQNPYQRSMDEFYARQYNQYGSNQYGRVITGINWAQGLEGAKSVVLKPGESAILMDSEQDRMFIKTFDEIGKPSVRIFRLVEEFEKDSSIDTSEFVKKEELQGIILDILGGMTNGTTNGEPIQPTNGFQQQTTVQNTGNAAAQYPYTVQSNR